MHHQYFVRISRGDPNHGERAERVVAFSVRISENSNSRRRWGTQWISRYLSPRLSCRTTTQSLYGGAMMRTLPVGDLPQTPAIDRVITSPTTATMAMHSKVEVAVQTDAMHPFSEAMMVRGMRPIITWSINRSGATHLEHSTGKIELPHGIRRKDSLILLWGPLAMYMVDCLKTHISLTFSACVHL